MTRLLGTTCGWESNSIDEAGTGLLVVSATGTVVSASPAPASGTYCYKVNLTSSTNNGYFRQIALGSQTDIWFRARLQIHLGGAETNANSFLLLRFLDTAGATVGCVRFDPTTNALRAYSGGGIGNSVSGTLLGSSSQTVAPDVWTLFEVHYIPTTGATGTFEIWLDGVQVLNLTSTTTSAGLANVAYVGVGLLRNAASGGAANSYVAYDDMAINNTAGTVNQGRCGDYRVGWLVPSGAGATTNWTPSAGSNYQCVDEIPPSAADYVSTTAAATVDDYAMTDTPATAVVIPYVESVAFGKNPDGGAGQLKVGMISGATTSAGTAQALGATDLYVRTAFELNPNTAAAWTKTTIDAAKLRIESA